MLVLSISGEISAQEKRDSVRIYFHNGGENGGFTGGIKKASGERPLCRPARDGRDREDAFNPAVG